MNEEKIYNAVSGIDEELLDRSLNGKSRRTAKAGFRWGIAAACLAAVVAVSSTALIAAAEAKEYDAALDFFAENELSVDGLSRSDVKAVYRDITQKKFTYEKTEEVIRRSVSGVEIVQRPLTPDDLADLWNGRYSRKQSRDGIGYRSEDLYETDAEGTRIFKSWTLYCYRYDELLWSAEFTDFSGRGERHTENGTIIWGQTPFLPSAPTYPWVALVNDEGEIRWQSRLDHGFQQEYVATVLQNEDGTFEVFSRGDYTELCLSRFDPNGNECRFVNTGVNCDTMNAARLGDGYIVQRGRSDLLRLDKDGHLTDGFTYEADDCIYYLTDMTEFAGQIYLSAYAFPKQNGNVRTGYELSDVLSSLTASKTREISNEELTAKIQENYTAVLLLCDPESGTPRTFYAAEKSLGGALFLNETGRLEWQVERIQSTFYSPATSSFTFGGASEVYVYTFDADGTLIGETDTGKVVDFRR